MQVGLRTTITVSLLLVLTGWPGISTANILTDIPKHNPLNIDWYPAPSPEDGPPLSAGALRDPAYLPAEIGGIVGAYVVSVCIVGIALILIGRRRHRHPDKQLVKSLHLDIEMVTPRSQDYQITQYPVTPGAHPASPRNFSWPSVEKGDQNPYVFPTIGGGQRFSETADSFVDKRVVQADQEMLQRDLEDIYAHVMAQEEAKAAGIKPAEMPPPLPLQSNPPLPPPQRSGTPRKLDKSRPADLNIDAQKSKSNSRTSSIISSLKSPKRRGIRGMIISSPIVTPIATTFPPADNAGDEEPLSPRYYAPPPPPPVPKDPVPYTHVRKSSQGSPISPTRSIAEQLSPDGAPPLHRSRPSQTSIRDPNSATSATSQTPFFPAQSQRAHPYPHNSTSTLNLQPAPQLPRSNPSQTSIRDPNSATSATSQTPLFPAQSQRVPPYNNSPLTVNLPTADNPSVRQLPFRQFEPAIQSPSFSYSTKTTVLERSNPLSPGLTTGGGPRTPWSAGAVPYSPYQPFSPMMPITPRLVTREDRKRMKKMEPRTPVVEMIKSEGDLFDSAY